MSDPRRLPTSVDYELKQRLRLGDWFAEMARNIAGDAYLAGPMTKALVVMWGPDGPHVAWHGRLTKEELVGQARRVVSAAIDPDNEARLVAWEADEQAKRAEYDARAFVCYLNSACGERFATERGLLGHQRAAIRRRSRCRDWSHGCGAGHPCGRLGSVDHIREDPAERTLRPVLIPVAAAE